MTVYTDYIEQARLDDFFFQVVLQVANGRAVRESGREWGECAWTSFDRWLAEHEPDDERT